MVTDLDESGQFTLDLFVLIEYWSEFEFQSINLVSRPQSV